MPLDLLPYQEEGARFLASKTRAGLFDEMGVGKTAQAIHALDLIGARRIVIVCPAAVREVWKGEFAKFARTPRRILKGRDIQDLNLWLRGKCDVLLLSYNMATTWSKHIEGDIFDALIFDEAHYLKNHLSNRSKKLLGSDLNDDDWKNKHGMARWAARVWFLTGTPNPNDAADIWSLMRFCRATRLSQKIFRDRYYRQRVGVHSATHTPRDEMVPELKQAIRSFSMTRTKHQAGLQLPPIWLTTTTVDGDTSEITELLRQYPELDRAILEAVEKGGLSFLDAQHIATLRRLVGEAKAPAYAELLKEELRDGNGKRVVFGLHVRALRHIHRSITEAGVGCVLFDGGSSETARIHAVEAFQTDPDCRVFVGNAKAAGIGVTLTAACELDMFEQPWDPASNAQTIMRVHRIGQDRAVQARFISLANSIDVAVAETVARKTAAIAKIGAGHLIGT